MVCNWSDGDMDLGKKGCSMWLNIHLYQGWLSLTGRVMNRWQEQIVKCQLRAVHDKENVDVN
jgi:hypothetical protein